MCFGGSPPPPPPPPPAPPPPQSFELPEPPAPIAPPPPPQQLGQKMATISSKAKVKGGAASKGAQAFKAPSPKVQTPKLGTIKGEAATGINVPV